MKILLINSVCGIRSTGRICTDLADVLTKEGHQCKIAYGRETVPEEYKKYAVRIGSKFSVNLDGFLTRLFDNAGFNSYFATKKFIKWVEEFNPDIIHLHNLHGYYINLKVLFSYLKKTNKPVIWTLHDCWTFTGHCSYFTMANCNKWETGCFKCHKKKAYPKSLILDGSKRNYKAKSKLFTSLNNVTFVTPSEWLADLVKKSFLGKHPVMAIPNGINLDIFKPTESNFREKYNLTGKKIILGAATSWTERKGLSLFSELAETLDDSYKVVLVGTTPEVEAKISDKILAVSRTNSALELAEIYTAADVFLNLGREETMGLTTVEAMACNTPVAASNCTAVPEVVSPEGGVVIDALRVDSIIKSIEQVLSTCYERPRTNAEKYEKTQQYMKYMALYESVIK